MKHVAVAKEFIFNTNPISVCQSNSFFLVIRDAGYVTNKHTHELGKTDSKKRGEGRTEGRERVGEAIGGDEEVIEMEREERD